RPSPALSFLLLLRRPRSTLFPYTTLFRSQRLDMFEVVVDGRDGAAQSAGDLAGGDGVDAFLRRQLKGGFHDGLAWKTEFSGAYSDRKSTRLNSSHVKISYAVFCLKKKKTT